MLYLPYSTVLTYLCNTKRYSTEPLDWYRVKGRGTSSVNCKVCMWIVSDLKPELTKQLNSSLFLHSCILPLLDFSKKTKQKKVKKIPLDITTKFSSIQKLHKSNVCSLSLLDMKSCLIYSDLDLNPVFRKTRKINSSKEQY